MNKSQSPIQSSQSINPKSVTPASILSILSRSHVHKQRLLKQLEQLDIDTNPLQKLTLHQIYNQVQPILKNTFSIKYLGLNRNQMGIVSRRIDPTKNSSPILNETPTLTYTINKYFYPKPLKVGKRQTKDQFLNVQNLENQIKRSFEQTKKKQDPKTKDVPLEKKKTQVHGSWLSIGKMKKTIYNEKRQKLKHIDPNRINLNELQKSHKPQVNSYASLMTKGILLVKDV